MNKKHLIISFIFSLCFVSSTFAYMEGYPPHKFKDGKFKHLECKPLVDIENKNYLSKDKRVVAELYEDQDSFNFLLKDGGKILFKMDQWRPPMPYVVYQVDLNKDKLDDFIVFSSFRGNGLAVFCGEVIIFLAKPNGRYQKIYYENMGAELDDFVDLNNDGKYEIIIGDTYWGKNHMYWTYNIYEINEYKLVNANTKFKGFPKFIWYTNDPNDKDTTRLSKEERSSYVEKVNNSIKYVEIK